MSSITLFPYSSSKDDVPARKFAYDYSNVLSFHTGTATYYHLNVAISHVTGDRHAIFYTSTYTANTVTGVNPTVHRNGTQISSVAHQISTTLAFGSGSGNVDYICMGGVLYNVATTDANSVYGVRYGAASGGTTTNTAMFRSGTVILKMGNNDVGNSMQVASASYVNTSWGATTYFANNSLDYWQTRNIIAMPNTGPYVIIAQTAWNSPSLGGTAFMQSKPLQMPAIKVFGPYSGSGLVNATPYSYSAFTNGWLTQNPADTGSSDSQMWSAAFVTHAQKNSQYRLLYTGPSSGYSIGVYNSNLIGLYLPDFENYYYKQNNGALTYHLDANNRILSGNSVTANNFLSETFYIKNPTNKHLLIGSISIKGWSGINNYIRLYNETTGEDYNDSQPFNRTTSLSGYSEGHQNFISRVVTFANTENKISWQSYLSDAQTTLRYIYYGAASIILLDLGTT